MAGTVILLHGFAGTARGWDPVVAELGDESYTALAPDLRGHGERSSARPVSFDAMTADVLAAAPGRFDLCGYSMGGRIALHVALAAPERVARLVLLSTTAGIDDDAERAARRRDDEVLAQSIEADGLDAFAERWLAQPLFAGDAPEARELARRDILRNRPEGLAVALRGAGTGSMSPLWDRLGELTLPAVVLTGALDEKFTRLGARLADALPGARHEVVAGAGHALPRTAASTVAAAISRR